MYYLYTTFSEVRSVCSIIFSRNRSSDKLITFSILSSLYARLERLETRLETQLDHRCSILERIEDRVSILDSKETVNLHLPGTVNESIAIFIIFVVWPVNKRSIMNGLMKWTAYSLTFSLDPSLRCKLCDVMLCYKAFRNKDNGTNLL